MKLKGQRLKDLYQVISGLYRELVGTNFSWKKGEKGRVKKSFIRMAESLGIRDDDQFEYVLDIYKEYIDKQMRMWLQWSERSRVNLIGTLVRKDDTKIFAAKYTAPEKEKDQKAKDLDVAGTQTEDEWEF